MLCPLTDQLPYSMASRLAACPTAASQHQAGRLCPAMFACSSSRFLTSHKAIKANTLPKGHCINPASAPN